MDNKINQSKVDERLSFTKVFNSFLKLFGLEEDAVCRELKISKTTFGRWVSGVSAPHQHGKKPVYESLLKMVKNQTRNRYG